MMVKTGSESVNGSRSCEENREKYLDRKKKIPPIDSVTYIFEVKPEQEPIVTHPGTVPQEAPSERPSATVSTNTRMCQCSSV